MADQPAAADIPSVAAPAAPAPAAAVPAAPAPAADPSASTALKTDLARVEADVAAVEAQPAAPAPAPAPTPAAPGPSAATIAAIIQNGLSNGPIAQSAATWNHLTTRLPEIVAAIMKEL